MILEKKKIHKSLVILLIALAAAASFLYFEFPWNVLRPIFHDKLIKDYSRTYNIDPLLTAAIIKVESNFSKRARSNRGAVGLMQVMPSTAQEISGALGYKDFSAAQLEDPETNIHFGIYYFSELLKEFNGNRILALAAYNAGKAKVSTWYKQNPMLVVETNDIPYPETRDYVKNVLSTYKWLKQVQELKNLVQGRKA